MVLLIPASEFSVLSAVNQSVTPADNETVLDCRIYPVYTKL